MCKANHVYIIVVVQASFYLRSLSGCLFISSSLLIHLWLRVVIRILLIPVVLGVSFEVLQFTNSLRDIPVLKYLGYPGLWLQLLTTKEPNDDMVEVSIASFKKLHEVEKNPEVANELCHD